MIEHLISIRPRVIHQENLEGPPEPPICATNDASGMICLSQENRLIIVQPSTVPDLIKVLRELAR